MQWLTLATGLAFYTCVGLALGQTSTTAANVNRYAVLYSTPLSQARAVTDAHWYHRGDIIVDMSHLRATFEERASDSPESSFVRAPAVQGRLQSRLHDAGYFSVSSDATPKGALDDVYAVALVSNSKQSQIPEVLTMASPLCALTTTATIPEKWALHFNAQGTLFHFTHFAGDWSRCSALSDPEIMTPVKARFDTLVEIHTPTEGQSLRLSSHKLVDPTDPEADRRETEEPKSFVAKYWYILLPLALMTLINSFGPEEKDATGSDGSESATKATKKREGKASSSKRA